MWPQLCTTFVCFYLLLLLKLSKQSSVRFFFLLLLATNSFIFCLLSYLQGQLFQGQIDFAEKLRIRSTKQKQKVCELLSVTTFPRIYQKSLVDTKEDLFCLLLQNMPTDFFIFRRLYFFRFAKSKCQNSEVRVRKSQLQMSSASLVTVLGPSSFTSITVLHFIKLPDYLITLLMMPFKKNCRVFSNPDT